MKTEIISNEAHLKLSDSDNIAQFRRELADWTRKTEEMLVGSIVRLTNTDKHSVHQLRKQARRKGYAQEAQRLAVSLTSKVLNNKIDSTPDKITFSFVRHGIFVHLGVGRGRPKSNPKNPKPWFNPVVDARMQELTEIVAKYHLESLVNITNNAFQSKVVLKM